MPKHLSKDETEAVVHGFHDKFVELTMCGLTVSKFTLQSEDRKAISCPRCNLVIHRGRRAESEQADAYAAHLVTIHREIETFCREAQLSMKRTDVETLLKKILEKADEQSPETVGIATASAKASKQRAKGKIRKV